MSELEDNDAFSPENSVKLSLIVQMRIYDVLLALLHDSDPEAAGKLYQAHAEGRVLGSLPWLDMQSPADPADDAIAL